MLNYTTTSTAIPRLAYSVDEAAQIIGISRRTVYWELSQGRLESLKVRNRRLISRRAIDAYLLRLEREAGAAV